MDSVAALTPKAEIEGDMGDNKVGLQARLMSQALRKPVSYTHLDVYTRQVENVSLFLQGMVVLASISFVITPPIVSIPIESGVTSNLSLIHI